MNAPRAVAVSSLIIFLMAAVHLVAVGSAAAQGSFVVAVDDVAMEDAASATVALRLEPITTVAAITIDASFPEFVQVITVEPLEGGICEIVGPRNVRFSGFDIAGWTSVVELCTVSITAVSSGSTPVELAIVTAADANAEIISGDVRAGMVTVGDSAAAPEPEPTATTAEPTTDTGNTDASEDTANTDAPEDTANTDAPEDTANTDAPEDTVNTDTGNTDAVAVALEGAEPATTDSVTTTPGTDSNPPASTDTGLADSGAPLGDAGTAGTAQSEVDAEALVLPSTTAPLDETASVPTPVDSGSGGNSTAIIATVAVAMFAGGGVLAAASRRTKRS